MAAADTARLIASLTLDSKGFTKGLTAAEKKLGQVESTAFRVGQNIGKGTQAAISNISKVGLVAAGGIALAVRGGLGDLAELENAVTSVDGAISQLGLTGQLTGKQVADWANDIEANIDAAFDDKAITQAATTLIRFGKVAPDSLRRALEVTADLAAKTGDVESASELLAKSLADPTKAAGKLSRQGIILTKAQQDTIKAMVKHNDVAGAQALVLDIVAKQTDGAAKAMAGPYQDALNKTNDAIEDARKALAIGFLPIITKVADKLSTIAADPKALASIKSFGETLAGGLDSLISTAERLPWAAIGTSLQIAGAGAKVLLDAFVSLPPWVQTAVLTGWGLNKLTGGALGGIVAELGKGLIKGVLGIQAAHVTVNAATVSGVGVPGAAPGGGSTGVLATAGKVASFVIPPAAALIIGTQIAEAIGIIKPSSATDQERLGPLSAILTIQNDTSKTNQHLSDVKANQSKEQQTAAQILASSERNESVAKQNTQKAADIIRATERAESIASQKADAQRAAVQTLAATERAESNRQIAAAEAAKAATAAGLARTAEAGRAAAAAIRDKDLSVSVQNINNIRTSVSVRETIDTQTTYKQYARYIS